MEVFYIGQNVKCLVEIRDPDTGNLKSSTVSTKITITKQRDTVVVNNVSMTPGTTGKYSYNWDTSTADYGVYDIKVVADDETGITIIKEVIELIH